MYEAKRVLEECIQHLKEHEVPELEFPEEPLPSGCKVNALPPLQVQGCSDKSHPLCMVCALVGAVFLRRLCSHYLFAMASWYFQDSDRIAI